MHYQQYYCIQSNDKLLSNNSIDAEFREILAEPVILVNDAGWKTFWKEEDYEMSVKIMFLIFLNRNFEDSFINESPISIEFFDQWWQLKKSDTPIHRNEILENIDSSIINKIELTGKDLPDAFINSLKK